VRRFDLRFQNAKSASLFLLSSLPPLSLPIMKLSPPEWKHFILTQYRSHCRGSGFDALAQRYGIAGGGRTVKDWYDRWDETPNSLKRKSGAGRPKLLSEEEVTQLITTPIRKKNRQSQPVHYTNILRPLQEQTGKKVSLRTVQRYGKENVGISSKRSIKKTDWECKYHIHIHSSIAHIYMHIGLTFIHSLKIS
jgi:transposase